MARMKVAGLFAGIGGLELGFESIDAETALLCELDANAAAVLERNFSGVPLEPDVRRLRSLPKVDVVTAGFPCQDLSQAGTKRGIRGRQSGLVSHLFELLERARPRPKWVVVENVSYMLRLNRGRAMRFLTEAFEELGYRWAYRVVDARAFGVPQRRLRVLLLASRRDDPREVLLVDDVEDPSFITHRLQAPLVLDAVGPKRVDKKKGRSYGFYWTEGRLGIGWATDAVPPIKGGSGLGIPSPPAVWVPSTGMLGSPSIADGEKLQGFPRDWTAGEGIRTGARWKLIGNAVCVPVIEWMADRLVNPKPYVPRDEAPVSPDRWPIAAFGGPRRAPTSVAISVWPVRSDGPVLSDFLEAPLVPLSRKAAQGFLDRALATEKIRYAPEFLDSVESYLHTLP